MRREISAKTRYKDFDSQKSLTVYLDYSLSKELSLNLMTLYQGLVSELEIEISNYSILLKLNNKKQSRCLSFNDKRAELSISRDSLELMINFLLKYYRDNIGEVKHIDLDFEISSQVEFTLTIELDKFKMISNKEMKKLLRD